MTLALLLGFILGAAARTPPRRLENNECRHYLERACFLQYTRTIQVAHGFREMKSACCRACVVEIVKHLPMACLSPGLEDKLYAKVQHLRHVVLRLYVVVDPLLPEHNNERLLIKAEVDPLILGRPNLELYAMITEYTISKLSHLAGIPEGSKELTPEILRRVRERANDFVDTPARDHVRAELYGLPGAWPCLLTWERND